MRRGILGWVIIIAMATSGCRAAAATAAPPRPPAGNVVRPGIDVLLDDSLHLVRGRRVGLVTNQTGVDRQGRSDVDRLRAAGVQLAALFSPEHGFRGAADPGAPVGSTRDSLTGLPIYSLYGRTVAPTPAMLEGLDLLVVDLQDVGARYYTYISTAIEVMRAAAPRGLPVIILDRPNPIGGAVQGNVLDPAFQTFVGRLAVPMRHGLTIGELARLANTELALGATLTVVPVAGWRRSMPFPATGLPWIPPSPNLRDQESLWHYPGTCLFEGTNLSVGRGTDAPFTLIGAPWLDAEGVIAAVQPRVQGVAFQADRVTPRRPGDQKYADTALTVIRLTVTDPARYDATETAVRLLVAIRRRHPTALRFLDSHFDRLSGTDLLRRGILADASPESLVSGWTAGRDTFLRRRQPVLLYDK